jgi:cytoskeleton protein RodZ
MPAEEPLPAPEKNAATATGTTLSPPPPEAQNMTLAISAREETWMKIIIDGGKPKEYTLNSGDRLLLEAEVAFNLLIGNAGGVDLRLNDRPVERPGKSGQVITLQLP